MKILLTGGAGYIGSHAALSFLRADHEITIYDNFLNSKDTVKKSIEEVARKTVKMIRGDIRDTSLLMTTLVENEIDAVVHFASLKSVSDSVIAPLDYFSNNLKGTISLLEAMRSAGVFSIIFSSSATVYGVPEYLPIDEVHKTSVTNPYGRTKLHIEEMLADLAASDSRWSACCLRYFNPVGAHKSSLLGESPQGTPNNLMPYLTMVANGELPHLNIYGTDYDTVDGSGVRDYVHVMDVADGHLAALKLLSTTKGWHAINLGTGRGTSVLELVSEFEKCTGKSIPVKIAARRLGDVPSCFASVTKAASTLGWSATRTLSEMCESSWDFQLRRNK